MLPRLSMCVTFCKVLSKDKHSGRNCMYWPWVVNTHTCKYQPNACVPILTAAQRLSIVHGEPGDFLSKHFVYRLIHHPAGRPVLGGAGPTVTGI